MIVVEHGRLDRIVLLVAALAAACAGHIDSDSVPPQGSDVPGSVQASGGSSSLGGAANAGDPALRVDPGPTLLRRLTNAEYSQTLADLLGEPPGADQRFQFPVEPRSAGFDNNAEVETVTVVHARLYLQAADAVASAVLTSPERRPAVFGCDTVDTTCIQSFVSRFGRRAYRRPLTDTEVSSYLQLYAEVGATDPEAAAKAVLASLLASPHFLFRVEVGQTDLERPGLLRLNGFEVATRLSYFLWGTTPDEALLDRAESGALDTADGLDTVATEMLVDLRAKPAIQRFYTQWMQLSDLAATQIDAQVFNLWSPELASAMAEETKRFVDSVIWDDGPGASVLGLLSARYTFVNGTLAPLYGLPAGDDSWRRVDFADNEPRVGILTLPGVLSVTSHSDSPSNTKRGLYVREVLLCQTVPPPPPGAIATLPAASPGETERERFARHTADPGCASCHAQMDPIGWGLSQFDAIGGLHSEPVDTVGRLEGMTPPEFDGPLELAQKLAQGSDFGSCLAKSLYRYAYGLGNTSDHSAAISEITSALHDSGYSFQRALLALVHSDSFRYRRIPQ